MIQQSVNQLLGTTAAFIGGGKYLKQQKEQTDAYKQTAQNLFGENVNPNDPNLVPPEIKKDFEAGLLEAEKGKKALLERHAELSANYAISKDENDKPILTTENEIIYRNMSTARKAEQERDAAIQQGLDLENQKNAFFEELKARREQMNYIGSANITDDTGFYANRATRQKIAQFEKENQQRFGGTK